MATVPTLTGALDTSTLETMISAHGVAVYIRDSTDKTRQSVFDQWWKETEVVTKNPINWNGKKTAKAWQFYKQCASKENGSPSVICIICQKVLNHPSVIGTSAISKHLLAREHVVKLNELGSSFGDLSDDKPVDQQVLAMLKTKGSQGVIIVSSNY
jgi:hypothetical protein